MRTDGLGQVMITVEVRSWAVHIYRQGQYARTIDRVFDASEADAFCKVFNAGGNALFALANKLVTTIEVDEEISVTEERV